MRRSDTLIKAISVILLIAIICYMGFHLADSFLNPLQTVIAVNASSTESVSCEGYAVRTEETLSAGGMLSPVQDGKKVSAGGVVAVSYGSDAALERADAILELEARIDRLKNISTDSGSDASGSIISLSKAVCRRELDDLDSLVYNTGYAVFGTGASDADPEAELSELKSQLSELKSQQTGYTYITADSPGIFTSAVDGFEYITPDSLEGITPERLASLFSSPRSTGAFGKLVYGTKWYFAAVLTEADAARLEKGGRALLSFTKNYSNQVSMTVESIGSGSGGNCVVIFSSDVGLSDVCSVREISADIIFSSYSGILTPDSAIYEDTDGTKYVYLLVGLQAKRVNVEVVCRYNEYYCLVKAAGNEILNEGAEIITKAKNLFDGKVVK